MKKTALMAASEMGHLDCVKQLLKAGAELNTSSDTGNTALIESIENGHTDCMEELIVAGADVNIRDKDHVSPLITAIEKGDSENVKYLLNVGVDVNVKNRTGDPALLVAVQFGHASIVQLLTEHGTDVNAESITGITPLYSAVSNGHAETNSETDDEDEASDEPVSNAFSTHTKMVYSLLQAGAHLNETSAGWNPCTAHIKPVKLDQVNFNILKVLSVAGGNVEGMPALVSNKINLQDFTRDCIRKHLKEIHPETNLYNTIVQLGLPHKIQSYLLFYLLPKESHVLSINEREFLSCSSLGDTKVVLSLIEAGMDANVQDENGMTALMMACENGHVELVEPLIKVGADVNMQALLGNTALIYATLNEHTECVRKLLEFDPNLDIQGEDGDTALMHAARNLKEDCLVALIESGANLNIQNDIEGFTRIMETGFDIFLGGAKGTTALIYATRYANLDHVKKLIEAGADVNNDDRNQGNSPLIAAVSIDTTDFIEELIKAGADLNIPNYDGSTALMLCSSYPSDSCFTTLMKAGAEVDTAYLANKARKLLNPDKTAGK